VRLKINYSWPFILAQHAALRLHLHVICGRIFNIGTTDARCGYRDAANYDTVKAAVEAMARSTACEPGPDGITVNCVVSSPIGALSGAGESSVLWQGIRPFVPVGSAGRVADIASAFFFRLPEAAFIMAQALP
jgi:NAD(P)-dependent dehydrogenase (short-subunit alcohol dehydrogenase family)